MQLSFQGIIEGYISHDVLWYQPCVFHAVTLFYSYYLRAPGPTVSVTLQSQILYGQQAYIVQQVCHCIYSTRLTCWAIIVKNTYNKI